ncbi:hypothetical protein [Sodalis sp.]|uniref:hypothetical protein n=1 Tax=Sodalis sp. (in: enterobacteria) TaxID=1898979 RepID=UPI0038735B05
MARADRTSDKPGGDKQNKHADPFEKAGDGIGAVMSAPILDAGITPVPGPLLFPIDFFTEWDILHP